MSRSNGFYKRPSIHTCPWGSSHHLYVVMTTEHMPRAMLCISVQEGAADDISNERQKAGRGGSGGLRQRDDAVATPRAPGFHAPRGEDGGAASCPASCAAAAPARMARRHARRAAASTIGCVRSGASSFPAPAAATSSSSRAAADASRLWRAAVATPASPSAPRSTSLMSTAARWRASGTAWPGGDNRQSVPWLANARGPPQSVDTTASPHAMASRSGKPKASRGRSDWRGLTYSATPTPAPGAASGRSSSSLGRRSGATAAVAAVAGAAVVPRLLPQHRGGGDQRVNCHVKALQLEARVAHQQHARASGCSATRERAVASVGRANGRNVTDDAVGRGQV
eukprot:365028-Chlamydomonas_euryale.AAC.35